ncbi:MAG: DUF6259 domain-containing protein, partial [Thermoguttaceae bacterium]
MKRRLPLELLLAITMGMALAPLASRAAAPSFEAVADSLRIESDRWLVQLDARKGALQRIVDRSTGETLLRGDADLWAIQRLKEPDIVASECDFRHEWNPENRRLRLDFDGADAAVQIVCECEELGPSWRAEVCMKRGTMIGWRFPNAVKFDASRLNQFIFPENLGLAFSRSFFQAGGAGLGRHALGPAGLMAVAGDRCQMRPVDDPPVAVRTGKDAQEWLPHWYVDELPRWRVSANRCPAGENQDLSLVETDHGCWLSGYRLGGWGWLFRVGGWPDDKNSRPVIASLVATLARLYRTAPENGAEVAVPAELAGKPPSQREQPPVRIGLILSPPTGRPGSQIQPDPSDIVAELGRKQRVADAGMTVVPLRQAAEIRRALAEPDRWFALVNTTAEGFPAESAEQAESMLQAIREYVRNGGIWWEAGGGYPFHHATVPQTDVRFETANRDFCDFAAIDSEAGRWAILGVQHPNDIYTPARAEIAAEGEADRRMGRYGHTFVAFARPEKPVQLPLQLMVLGKPHRECLAEYAARNQFVRGLADKASPEMVEKLKRAILLKVTTNDLRASAGIARELPQPVLFHVADYLHGGFDKQYPDHLPPRPEVGSAEDFAGLVQACREEGHLFMPYTNPTWWCVNPKGPTFERQGDACLSRDWEGKIYPERYGLPTTQGYTVCAWHGDVRAANDVIRKQFTEQYPVAVLFQDQVGARGTVWDTNPAAPHPGAYLEGIHRIARVDSQSVPLGTEDGQDRLINWETMFCGLSWPWLPNGPGRSRILYEDLWPRGSWRIEPLALFLAHDKVLFYHHDLGGFVRDRLDLSITLVMGYGLSWSTRTAAPDAKERDWIERLCRIQATVGPRCAGRALDGFEYLAPAVICSRWGDLEIVANLAGEPWRVDAETTLAPEGFLARSPDLEAGILIEPGRPDLPGVERWTVREK